MSGTLLAYFFQNTTASFSIAYGVASCCLLHKLIIAGDGVTCVPCGLSSDGCDYSICVLYKGSVLVCPEYACLFSSF